MEDNRSPEVRKEIGLNMISMAGSALRAIMREDLDWSEALSEWQTVFHCAQFILEHPETTEDEKRDARNNLRNSVYGMAHAFFELEEYQQAEEILEYAVDAQIADKRADVLLGICYVQTADRNDMQAFLTKIRTTFILLRTVEQNPELELDAKIKHTAWMHLAFLYRNGRNLNILNSNDIESAYRCITMAATIPDLPDAVIDFTNAELHKYKKGLFGGYSYKE